MKLAIVFLFSSTVGAAVVQGGLVVSTLTVTQAISANITSGSSVSLGSVYFDAPNINPNALLANISVWNTGSVPILLGNGVASSYALVSGANANLFSISTYRTLVLPAGVTSKFTVSFQPTASGSFSALITIPTNDTSGTFTFTVTGTSATLLSSSASCVAFSTLKNSILMTSDTLAVKGCFPLGLVPSCVFNGVSTTTGTLLSVSDISCPTPPLYTGASTVPFAVSFTNGYYYKGINLTVVAVQPSLSSSSGGLLGGEGVSVTGVVFSSSQVIKCRVGTQIGSCTYISSSKANCVIPILYAVGPLGFDLSVDGGLTFPFLTAPYFVFSNEEYLPTLTRVDPHPLGTTFIITNTTVAQAVPTTTSASLKVEATGNATLIYSFPNKDYQTGTLKLPFGFVPSFSTDSGQTYVSQEPLSGITNIQVSGLLPANPGTIVPVPTPTAASVSAAGAGGDGFEPLILGRRVHNVWHHVNPNLVCLYMDNGTSCNGFSGSPYGGLGWGVTVNGVRPGTSNAPVGFPDQDNQRIYYPANLGGYTDPNTDSGFVCIEAPTNGVPPSLCSMSTTAGLTYDGWVSVGSGHGSLGFGYADPNTKRLYARGRNSNYVFCLDASNPKSLKVCSGFTSTYNGQTIYGFPSTVGGAFDTNNLGVPVTGDVLRVTWMPKTPQIILSGHSNVDCYDTSIAKR